MMGLVSTVSLGLAALGMVLPNCTYNPSTYSNSETLPSRVYFTQSLGNLAGYEYDTSKDYALDHDESFKLYLDYAYVPFYVDISYSDAGYSIDYIQFVTIKNPVYSDLVPNVPYFIEVSSAGADWYSNEYGFSVQQNFFANASGGELLFVRAYTDTTTNFFGSNGTLGYQVYYDSAINTWPSDRYVSVYGDVFIKYFEKFAWSYIASLSKTYATALSNANQNGYDSGYDVGYNAGLVADSDPVSTLSGLFAVIMDFPITILNGFSGFVVWNTPVMTILISFAVMGLVLWVVKRFIK